MGNAIGRSGIPNPASPLVQASTFIFSRNPGRTLAGYQAMNDEQDQRKALPGMVSSMFPVPGDKPGEAWSGEQQGAIDNERKGMQYAKAFPEQTAALIGQNLFPKAADPYTLGEGDTRFGGNGQVIARGAAKPQSQTIGTLVSPDGKSRRSMNIASPKAQELMDSGWVKADDLQKQEPAETFGEPQQVMENGQAAFYRFGNRGGKMPVTGLSPPPRTDRNPVAVADSSSPTGQRFVSPESAVGQPAGGTRFNNDQNKAAGFANSMNQSEQRLNELGPYDPTSTWETVRGATNNTASTNKQKYDQAKHDWSLALLRFESGANVPDAEAEKYYDTYFPKYGDSAATIQQKADARADKMRGVAAAAGGAFETLNKNEPHNGAAQLSTGSVPGVASGGRGGWSIKRIGG